MTWGYHSTNKALRILIYIDLQYSTSTYHILNACWWVLYGIIEFCHVNMLNFLTSLVGSESWSPQNLPLESRILKVKLRRIGDFHVWTLFSQSRGDSANQTSCSKLDLSSLQPSCKEDCTHVQVFSAHGTTKTADQTHFTEGKDLMHHIADMRSVDMILVHFLSSQLQHRLLFTWPS